MDVAPSTGAVKVALRPFKVGARCFEPGDRYEPAPGALTEREEVRLSRLGFVKDFTPQTYRNAIGRRPAGTLGAGWSAEFLYQTGALERPAGKEQAGEPFVPREDDLFYLGYVMRPRQAGVAVMALVMAPNGERMAEKEFRSVRKAREFIDTLPALEVKISNAEAHAHALEEITSLSAADPVSPAGVRVHMLEDAIEVWEESQAEGDPSPDSAASAIQGEQAPESADDVQLQS